MYEAESLKCVLDEGTMYFCLHFARHVFILCSQRFGLYSLWVNVVGRSENGGPDRGGGNHHNRREIVAIGDGRGLSIIPPPLPTCGILLVARPFVLPKKNSLILW